MVISDRRARQALAVLVVLAFLFGGFNLYWTLHVVNTSQHHWCSTLDLLTSNNVPKPAHPEANPSRENAYIYYTDFRQLRSQLGCG